MFEELLKAVKSQLNERAASPLLGSFVISWSVINYKIIIVLLSDSSFKSKFRYINETLYSDNLQTLAYGLIIPAIIALLYIFVFPIPAHFVFKHHRRKQIELNNKKKEIEDGELLSLAESRDIRNKINLLELEREKEVEELNAEIIRLKETIKHINDSSSSEQEKTKENEIPLEKIEYEIINQIGNSDNTLEFNLIFDELRKSFNEINKTIVEYHIQNLIDTNYLKHFKDDFGGTQRDYGLTQKGKKAYLDYHSGMIKTSNILNGEPVNKLSNNEKNIINHLSKSSKPITRGKLAEILGISQATSFKYSSSLISKGYVELDDNNALLLTTKGKLFVNQKFVDVI